MTNRSAQQGAGNGREREGGGLDEAMARLDRTLGLAQAGGAAVSFDAFIPEPERALMEAKAMRAGGDGIVSFAAGPGEGTGLAARVLDDLLAHAGATVRAETRAAGRLVASTRVGLGGDAVSALDAAATPADLARHVEAVGREVGRRAARMRVLVATLEAAAKISLAMGTGNVLLAVPAAARFVRGVMAEREERGHRT